MKTLPGSFGSRGGEPWSAKLSQANRRTTPSETAAGTYGAVIAPSIDALRAAIQSQLCPWCGAGPFRILARHTVLVHGVSGMELRDMAGISRSSSICSAESSEASRRALISREDREEMTMRGSLSGRAIASAVAKELSAKRYTEMNSDRDAQIISAVNGGRQRQDVALEFGIQYKTVLAIMKRHGEHSDGRVDRGVERRGKPVLSAMRGVRDKSARALSDRAGRWSALGGGNRGIELLALELGISRKTLRGYFRSNGVEVPDGRRQEEGCGWTTSIAKPTKENQ